MPQYSFDPATTSGARALSLPRLRRRKELAQLATGFFRRFVRKIVPARKRLAGANVRCIARPNLHRLVVAADAAVRAPQHSTGQVILRPAAKSSLSMARSTPWVAR